MRTVKSFIAFGPEGSMGPKEYFHILLHSLKIKDMHVSQQAHVDLKYFLWQWNNTIFYFGIVYRGRC
jgi:hypothetical protein